jgi:hypothetical protein
MFHSAAKNKMSIDVWGLIAAKATWDEWIILYYVCKSSRKAVLPIMRIKYEEESTFLRNFPWSYRAKDIVTHIMQYDRLQQGRDFKDVYRCGCMKESIY